MWNWFQTHREEHWRLRVEFWPSPIFINTRKRRIICWGVRSSRERCATHFKKSNRWYQTIWRENGDFGFTAPSRDSRYTLYVHNLLRRVLTKHDITRSLSGRSPDSCYSTFHVLMTIYYRCFGNEAQYVNKRGIYYSNVKLFKSKPEVAYGIIDDVCYMLRCTSLSLRVISDTTGTVIGPFTFVCGDTPHKCSSSAKKIPSCQLIPDTRFNNCKVSFSYWLRRIQCSMI